MQTVEKYNICYNYYFTITRWHLGHCNPAYLPTNRGFDTQFGIQNSGGYNTAHIDYVPPHPYDFFENDVVKKDFDTRVTFQMVSIYNSSTKSDICVKI